MKKKLFSLALAAVMTVASTVTAFAADADSFEVLKNVGTYTAAGADTTTDDDNNPLIEAMSTVTETTGFAISFVPAAARTSDWDSNVVSADWLYQMGTMLMNYDPDGWGTGNANIAIFEGAATLSEDGIARLTELGKATDGSANWEIFLNTTDRMTVSFNPDGSIGCYLGGKLMMTYASTVENLSAFWTAMIDSAANDGVRLAIDATDVKVGYAVGYESPAPTPTPTPEPEPDTADVAPVVALVAVAALAAVVVLKKRTVTE